MKSLSAIEAIRDDSACRRTGLSAFAVASALILAGCGDKVQSVSSAPPPVAQDAQTALQPAPGLAPNSRYELVLDLLQQGNAAQARVELVQLKKDKPSDRRIDLLMSQIDSDPKQLYGGDNFAYTMRSGDTLFSLARDYLHDALNFYGLSRYNGLKMPARLQPGDVILIPGHARTPPRRLFPRRPTVVPTPPAAAQPRPSAAPEPSSPDAAARRGQAQELRRRGLEQMSAGSIDRAVTLLSQAATLDPGNAAIAADLARARRVQATVRSQ